MITVWFWITIAIFSMILLGSLPGVREVFRPLMDMLSKGFVELLKFSGGYILWFIKTILRAHLDLASHLAHKKSYFDPTEDMRQ